MNEMDHNTELAKENLTVSINASFAAPAPTGETVTESDNRQTTTDSNALTEQEKKKLSEMEQKIQKVIGQGRTIGQYLKTIKEQRLYRDKYLSFKAYCLQKWEMSDVHAYRMIGHYEICQIVGVKCSDVSEKTTRPVYQLQATDEIKKQLWEKAKDADGVKFPTTRRVSDVVREYLGKNRKDDSSSEEVYVAKLKRKFVRERLAEELIHNISGLQGLYSCAMSVLQYLSPEGRSLVKEECASRMEHDFQLTE